MSRAPLAGPIFHLPVLSGRVLHVAQLSGSPPMSKTESSFPIAGVSLPVSTRLFHAYPQTPIFPAVLGHGALPLPACHLQSCLPPLVFSPAGHPCTPLLSACISCLYLVHPPVQVPLRFAPLLCACAPFSRLLALVCFSYVHSSHSLSPWIPFDSSPGRCLRGIIACSSAFACLSFPCASLFASRWF